MYPTVNPDSLIRLLTVAALLCVISVADTNTQGEDGAGPPPIIAITTPHNDNNDGVEEAGTQLPPANDVPVVVVEEEDAGLAYQYKTAHRSAPIINNLDSALGITGSEKELYEQSIASKKAANNADAEIIETEPINLPCHLLNEYEDRANRNIHPFKLNYTSALGDIVTLLKDLQSQYTPEHQYVCPPTKIAELRRLLDNLGEIQSFHTRREQLRHIGGKSFGTLGPHCASHLIVASDVFGSWGVAAETLYNGISASERHCTTGWANFLAFLSNAPGLQAPNLQTPECMRRPSYARCFQK